MRASVEVSLGLVLVFGLVGCGKIESDQDPIRCCFDVKTSPNQLFWDEVCHVNLVCPGGYTQEDELCDQYCPLEYPSPMSGFWNGGGVGSYYVWDCKTNEYQTEPVPGAGDDEAYGETGECDSNNAPPDPPDILRGDVAHFSLTSTANDIELTIGAYDDTANYTLSGSLFIDDCINGTPYCYLTLTSLTLETDSSMTFGSTTVLESKVILAETATTQINMTTGAFSFSATDSFVVGVSWEEDGTPVTENSTNLSNGTDDISGTINFNTPSITFDGTVSKVGGSLDIDNVEVPVDNIPPDANESNSDPLIDCIPSVEDPHKTWAELDATATVDPDNNITAWVWYVDDEIVGEDEITEALLGPGTYDVVLLVYDAFGAWSSTGYTLEITDSVGACA